MGVIQDHKILLNEVMDNKCHKRLHGICRQIQVFVACIISHQHFSNTKANDKKRKQMAIMKRRSRSPKYNHLEGNVLMID